MIKHIKLKSFRRFKNLDIDTSFNLIILCGQNAIGKTTILEGIHVCSTALSHKTKNILDLIRHDDPFARIHLEDEEKSYDVVISQKGRKMMINNNPISKLSDFIGHLQVVMFSPQDINVVLGEKSLKRSFFDLEISVKSKGYLVLIQQFKKILKKRNEILKLDNIDEILLDTITKEMNIRQEKIIKFREKFINSLNEELKLLKGCLGYDELVKIIYKPSVYDNLDDFYKNNLNQDKITKMTNYGIHRDNYIFLLNGKEASKYASQGQLRSIALLIRIALCNLSLRLTGKRPILLLDDVFSELDDLRCRSLVKFLSLESQTFITTTNLLNIPQDLRDKAYIINLKE